MARPAHATEVLAGSADVRVTGEKVSAVFGPGHDTQSSINISYDSFSLNRLSFHQCSHGAVHIIDPRLFWGSRLPSLHLSVFICKAGMLMVLASGGGVQTT